MDVNLLFAHSLVGKGMVDRGCGWVCGTDRELGRKYGTYFARSRMLDLVRSQFLTIDPLMLKSRPVVTDCKIQTYEKG